MGTKPYLTLALALTLNQALAGAAGMDGIAKQEGDVIARIHFVGSSHIAADSNAAKLNEILALPETGALRDEILQKLATTPFRVMNQNSPPRTNDHAALLRPLLEDVLKSESYLEVRGPTNAWPEVMLAVKLDNTRAGLWRTNLATTLLDWTGIPVTNIEAAGFPGWELKKHHNPNVFRFVRADDWAVFGWGQDELRLQPAILEKIKHQKRPVSAAENYWLEAWMDWPAFTERHPLALPFKLPKMRLNVEGRNGFLRPELKMQFAEPLDLKLEAWQIPTNLIFDPVSSITFARGFGPWLGRLPTISNLNAGPPPNQAVIWAMQNIPFETCMVAPAKGARSYLAKIGPPLISLLNSNLTGRDRPGEAVLTTNQGIAILGFPYLAPFLLAITNEPAGDYLLGGFFASPPHAKPYSWDSILGVISPTNVVYYDWEVTAERMYQWRPLSQIYFMVASNTLPKTDAPAQKWLLAVKPKLEPSATVVTLSAPDELTLVRNAELGLTGIELVWLGIWVDGPGFPLEANMEPTYPWKPWGMQPHLK